jgi:ATP-dependent Clp protease ATP-binding subunit ClpC
MTTNAGAEAIKNEASFGFQRPDNDASYDAMKQRVMDQVERVFRPEFLNRLDDTIIFRHLNKDDLKKVIDFEMSKVRKRLEERGFRLELTDEAKEFIIKKGSNLDYGARPLRRALEQRVEDPLAEELLRGTFEGKDTITISVVKDDEGKVTRLDFRGEIRGKSDADLAAASS